MSASRPLHPTALVTGGNRGLGRAIALGLMARGVKVTIGAREAALGAQAAREVGCDHVHLDLTEAETWYEAFRARGGWDILINNAGIYRQASLLEPGSDFTEAMEVMVAAPLDLIRMNLGHWKRRGWGRIVNISSGLGSHARGLGGPGAYSIAKAGLNALTRVLPRDLPEGVKVNACDPGWLRTRMGGEGAPLSAEEGAETAVWLALLPEDGPTGGFFRRMQPAEW